MRFNVPYAAYDKATWVRAPTPYYARDAAELEDPVTDTESSSGVSVRPGVQADIDIMTDNTVNVFVRPAPLLGDAPDLGTPAQCSYSSSQSMYAFQDERDQPMPPGHIVPRQDVPTGVRQPPLLSRADVVTRPPAAPPLTTADLVHAHAARTPLQPSCDVALPLTDQYVAYATRPPPPSAPLVPAADLISVHATRLPSEPARVATITTAYDRSTTTSMMHGYTTTTVTPTTYAYTQPRADRSMPPAQCFIQTP